MASRHIQEAKVTIWPGRREGVREDLEVSGLGDWMAAAL